MIFIPYIQYLNEKYPSFFIFLVFFSIFPQNPKKHCEADLAWRFFRLPSAMSILPITALIKHKIAAGNHELAIQV